ncbi:unnamed protein product [Protopolystoma xenopodis]|uniref:Reverse transcriptase domain-containing protein n=1 Tax=Protopolystoma xenopodis TaxID=117903 RepID=A0A3S5ANE8_9PLAT|nr:unnamed protein product [Protopolystoma xenopodis]
MLEAERIRKESLTRLINLTVRTTFNGSIYEQIFGLPMEPPLFLLENLYMDKSQTEFEKSLLQPRVLIRYLDDYFALWSHGKEDLDEFLNFINQLDERIKFTMEVEEDERPHFLDIEVMRSKGSLLRRLYRRIHMQE